MCVIPSVHGRSESRGDPHPGRSASRGRGSASRLGPASRGRGLHQGGSASRGYASGGSALRGVGRHPQILRDTVNEQAGGTHPTGMHSCFLSIKI